MQDLTPTQLESIRRLLVDPLRETIKSEVQLSHDRLTASIRKLTDQFSTHAHASDARLTTAERELTRQRSFRRRLVAVYGVIALLLSLAGSFLRDRLLSLFNHR